MKRIDTSTPVFYSQHGEDAVLHELFRGQETGFFVEVGCIDGRRFSNTLTFEERGWHGICVEAHDDYIPMLVRNRPGSIVCHCAVGDREREAVPFFANRRGSLSTLDASRESEFRTRFGRYFSGFAPQTVPLRTLSGLFGSHEVQIVDILSIDVEGTEIDVLRGLDLNRYRPRVLVVEADSATDENRVSGFLQPAGYACLGKVANNCFYLPRQRIEYGLHQTRLQGMVRHTRHPLDEGEDSCVPYDFTIGLPAEEIVS